jgi:hypothetical protein
MTQLKTFVLSLALATVAATAWADAPVEMPEAPTGVVEGVAADGSPEMQAERDEFVAQWEASARAAGIDPETVEADTGQSK